MKRQNKNILIILSIGIVLIISMFFVFNNKNNEYKELPKVKLKEENKPKQFALMLEQDNGKYQASEGELPTEGYVFNEEKSGCTDINGKIIEDILDYNYENYSIVLNTNKTAYCYLYYDIEPNIRYLRSKDTGNNITKNLTGGIYRYQGTDNVPNWIIFGTKEECNKNEEEKCTNTKLNDMTYDDYVDKYMYRIIGITPKGQLYLLKETFLKEDEVASFAWNDEYQISGTGKGVCPDGVCPEWNEADLFQRINGIANGTNSGTGGYDSKADTDIFVDSGYYDYLKSGDKFNGGGNEYENGEEKASEWYKLIDTHSWYYGDIIERGNNLYKGNIMYNIETGVAETSHYIKEEDGSVISQTYKWTNKVDAKISLMYIHDYDYAYPGGNPENVENVANSWIHFRKDGYNMGKVNEWLSTRYGIDSTNITDVGGRHVYIIGSIWSNVNSLYINYGVRPVFYISSDAKIASGEGTKDSPYVLN